MKYGFPPFSCPLAWEHDENNSLRLENNDVKLEKD